MKSASPNYRAGNAAAAWRAEKEELPVGIGGHVCWNDSFAALYL